MSKTFYLQQDSWAVSCTKSPKIREYVLELHLIGMSVDEPMLWLFEVALRNLNLKSSYSRFYFNWKDRRQESPVLNGNQIYAICFGRKEKSFLDSASKDIMVSYLASYMMYCNGTTWDNHGTSMRLAWDELETSMRQAWGEHETSMRQA